MAEDWTPKDNWSPNNHNHDSKYSKLSHLHDDRYSQTSHNHDTVYSKLGHVHDYASSNHNHDDRYYTESEINTKLAKLSGIGFPNYASYTTISSSPYTCTKNGWIQCEGYRYGEGTVKIGKLTVMHFGAQFSEENDGAANIVPVSSGDVVTFSGGVTVRFVNIK